MSLQTKGHFYNGAQKRLKELTNPARSIDQMRLNKRGPCSEKLKDVWRMTIHIVIHFAHKSNADQMTMRAIAAASLTRTQFRDCTKQTVQSQPRRMLKIRRSEAHTFPRSLTSNYLRPVVDTLPYNLSSELSPNQKQRSII